MSFTLKLDRFSHDLIIKGGRFLRVQGADEVRQRVKVSLWHLKGEYFLNRLHGIPWYTKILGYKMKSETLTNILRKAILDTPGVLKIYSLQVASSKRVYSVQGEILVKKGPGDLQGTTVSLDGIRFEE